MAIYRWVDEAVPEAMKITQVYAIILDHDGRILLRREKTSDGRTKYSLAGGRPEPYDRSLEDTCRRELKEEINTETETPVYIGYQLVDEENGTPPYAQVRMAALIRKIGLKKPDPDTGKTYDRLLVSPGRAIQLLGWGDIGAAQILKAQNTTAQKYGIRYSGKPEEWT